MNKIQLLFLFALTASNMLNAQTSKTSELLVQYDMFLNFKGSVQYNAELILNTNYSLFKYKPDDKELTYKEEAIDADSKVNVKIIDSAYSFVFIDKRNKAMIEKKKAMYFKEMFKVKESIPVINWVLTDEVKSIGELSCNKATCFLKGRNYTVWYCLSIPTGFGPWKLNGLPGLIVEAVDNENQVAFYLKKIISPYNKEIQLEGTETEKIYSNEEFLKIQKDAQDEFQAKMETKFDRGTKVKMDFKYDGIER
ncbi:GLPGLI family protein [Flavobacterium sp.]|jgi:GLPGLI family protein|uniref:GLPGLI family protein n=1 Tax=Flavobacterium sp. TaxID=239 RepID=UPI003918CEE6